MLDYAYVKRKLQTNCSWFKQIKNLNTDPRAIQQIVFQGVAGGVHNTKIRLCTILEKSKETVFEFHKGIQRNSKSFVRMYKWLNTIKQMLNY